MTQPATATGSVAAIVAFGANVALPGQTPESAIVRSLTLLDSPDLRLEAQSRLYRTPCFPAGAGPDYVNAAAVFRTRLSADALLARLHDIEIRMGRTRTTRWGRRTMDLDLLAFGDAVMPDIATWRHWQGLPSGEQMLRAPDTLIVPHPRLADRAFVLIPMRDVAPDWRHPVTGQTVTQMAAVLPPGDDAQVVAIT